MLKRITPLVHQLKSVISALAFILILIPVTGNAQDKCTIQYSGKLYTTKSDLPINCHRPGVDDKNFTYDTAPIKEESETVALPLKQSIMFVDEIAGWFVVFDKKDHLCSSESVFTPSSGEYNFTALTKKNELIRGFVPNVYLNRINPSSYPAYANSLKQGDAEQIMVSDLVISVGMVRNDSYKVAVHVNASELSSYQSKLIELLTLPQNQFSDTDATAVDNQNSSQQPVASNNETEIQNASSQSDAITTDDAIAQRADEKENTTAQTATNQSKAKPVKEKKVKEIKVKEKKEKAPKPEKVKTPKPEKDVKAPKPEKVKTPKPEKEDKTSNSSSPEIVEEMSSEVDTGAATTISTPSKDDNPEIEEKNQTPDQVEPDQKAISPANEENIETKPEATPVVEETTGTGKVTLLDSEDTQAGGQLNLGKRYVPKDNPEMTEADKEEISEIAMIQLKRLEDSFKTLVDRNISAHIKKKMRENTVQTLFVNDKAEVSVSSAARSAISFHFIPEYLERLEQMFYQRVEIDFSDIHKVTDLKKNPDGTWTGIVTFTQVFKGYDQVDGLIPRYGDVTHKSVTIIVRKVETFSGDARPDVEWIVLLGDIGVNETQKI